MESKKYVINVFCDKGEMNNLLRKVFGENDYDMRYNIEINPDDLSLIHSDCDCIIIDRSIDKKLQTKISEIFGNISTVYLPSLDNENNNGHNATYISEPLKLSELKKTVEGLLT